MTPSGRRLTSWKEIASHLGRDVRTVMRWEKERALPVHRGPGGKSGVVFADMDELDAWTRGDKAAPDAAVPDAAPSVPVARAAPGHWRAPAAAAALLALAVGLGGWRLGVSRANEPPGSVVMTDRAVIARNADGSEKWRYEWWRCSIPTPSTVSRPRPATVNSRAPPADPAAPYATSSCRDPK